MSSVRICVCGDEGVGKSSICVSLVKDVFVVGKIQPVLPQITIPPKLFGAPENVTTIIVDTSALPQDRENLRKEIRKCNCLLLVYADHYSYERVSLFWCPLFRSLGVNVPIVLCANKSDLTADNTSQVVKEEMLPVMAEFKEIDSCIRTSAKVHHNINEVFFLCQKAVTHPIAPLFDSKESSLKPAATTALRNVFYLIDDDHNGHLDDEEMEQFQLLCFEKPLSEADLDNIKQNIRRSSPDSVTDKGIDLRGFLALMKTYIEKGRHESVWIILRRFHYTDSLSLQENILHPKFVVPAYSSVELSPAGYRFFVDLFLLFDQDKSGGLNDAELSALFAPYPAPGLPASWIDSPSSIVRNEAGEITLQGWLAQWSMTTFIEPRTTLEFLAYLGFDNKDRGATTTALKITKARKKRKRPGRVERNVVLCYVLGASSSGKSSLLDAFLNRPFSQTYHPTIKPRTAVNSVELHGGKQCYLIMEELGELEPAILENQSKLDACDIICYTWDSADPDSWSHIVELRKKYPYMETVPAIYVGLKADKDKATQRSETQPAEYTSTLKMPAPLHVSVTWNTISEFFVDIAESAIYPSNALPKSNDDMVDRTNLYIALSATVCSLTALGVLLWRRTASPAA